jgi:PAS domain S-box-containing protein
VAEISGDGSGSVNELLLHRIILDNSSDPIFCIDRTGKYLYINHAFGALLQKQPDDIIGKRMLDIFPGKEGDQRFADVRHVFETGEMIAIEVKVQNESEWLYFMTSVTPVKDSAGNVQIVICMSRDITLRKQAEEKLKETQALLQAALDNSQAGIAIADAPDGKLRFVNRAGLLIRDKSEEEVVKNVSIDDYVISWNLLHLDGTPYQANEVPLSRAVMYGDTSSEEFIIRRDNLEDRVVWANAAPVKDEHGRIIAGIVVFLDVTERKKTESELKEANKSAEAAARAESRFLSDMSHEIRTPLHGIRGMIQLLEGTPLTEDQKEFVRLSRISSDTLMAVLNDILDYSKIKAGKMALEKIPFMLRTVINDCIGMLGFDIVRKSLRMESCVDEDVPDILIGDPFRLRQVLNNLIGNAVKYTNEGRIDVCVRLMGKIDKQRICLEFAVNDTGIGIPAEMQDFLFKSFSQIDSSDTRKHGGTGLGLAISKNLVELMEGDIWVEAIEGKGSSFLFTCVLETL